MSENHLKRIYIFVLTIQFILTPTLSVANTINLPSVKSLTCTNFLTEKIEGFKTFEQMNENEAFKNLSLIFDFENSFNFEKLAAGVFNLDVQYEKFSGHEYTFQNTNDFLAWAYTNMPDFQLSEKSLKKILERHTYLESNLSLAYNFKKPSRLSFTLKSQYERHLKNKVAVRQLVDKYMQSKIQTEGAEVAAKNMILNLFSVCTRWTHSYVAKAFAATMDPGVYMQACALTTSLFPNDPKNLENYSPGQEKLLRTLKRLLEIASHTYKHSSNLPDLPADQTIDFLSRKPEYLQLQTKQLILADDNKIALADLSGPSIKKTTQSAKNFSTESYLTFPSTTKSLTQLTHYQLKTSQNLRQHMDLFNTFFKPYQKNIQAVIAANESTNNSRSLISEEIIQSTETVVENIEDAKEGLALLKEEFFKILRYTDEISKLKHSQVDRELLEQIKQVNSVSFSQLNALWTLLDSVLATSQKVSYIQNMKLLEGNLHDSE